MSLICLMCAVLLLGCVKYWEVVRNLGGCMVRRKCLHIKKMSLYMYATNLVLFQMYYCCAELN